MSNIDALLDVTLDDLADLPEFKNFQPGAHSVTATWGTKEINDAPYATLDFTLVETLELADPNEEQNCAAGDSCGVMFSLTNEFGQGNLKKAMAPFLEALNMTTLRQLIEDTSDVECTILTGLRKNKNDPDKPYLELKEVQVA